MKKILLPILLICGLFSQAQLLNNEWIDYSKTYFKFKVGKDGVFRITQSTLANAGLGGTPSEQFQLWRNGVQVPLFVSVASGPLTSSDYIEFWGQMNDGKPDRQLYRNTSFQLNDKWSLQTDTASYFLTVNPATSENMRLVAEPNLVAGNTLSPEPYFLHTIGNYFKARLNSGFAVNVGENLYSSSYDRGEGWSSSDIISNANTSNFGVNSNTWTNLFVYNGGPSPKFKIAVSGNAINQRRFRVNINGDSITGKSVDYFNATVDSTSFSLASISSGTAVVNVTNFTICSGPCPTSDRMVVHQYEMTYPRQFNFGGAANFEFSLDETAVGNYLEISNFSHGGTAPVLYDFTNGKKYTGDISVAPLVRFVLPPSSVKRKFVLVGQQAANLTTVSGFEQRNFINYATVANQADYIILSNTLLFNGPNGSNPVEDYKNYRNSVAGGSYNARIFLDKELEDQFGFGIKKHPVAIRNFLRFARQHFSVAPKFVFIIGKGVHYVHQRTLENGTPDVQQNLAKLNLVPTFGWPASDILLSADPGSSVPQTPIGRLSAISAAEVALYLDKVKDYEQAQKISSPSIADKGWKKNVVHIVGASEGVLASILDQSMNNFAKIIADTMYGGKVTTFSKSSSDAVQQLASSHLTNLFNEGISIMTYFGHSSASTLEFNLDDPENYNNAGKYPLFIALGCNAGNFFNYNTVRLNGRETISEKYVLAANRGTIGFIASSHFGIVHYLDIWNTRAYRRISNTSYGKSIGEIMKGTIEDVFATTTQEDFYARSNAEETQFHGDPALVINAQPKPDYVVEAPMVKISPDFISVADVSFKVEAKMQNIGKALPQPVVIEIKRQFPDQTVSVIKRDTIPGIRSLDSISYNISIDPIHDKGLNKIIFTIDPDNLIDELYTSNNSVTKEIMIYEDEARPIYPFNYGIVGQQNIKLIASTANPFAVSKNYRMEMDTTAHFNSSLKVVKTIATMGGTMEFDPAVSLLNNTVYYWRVSPDAGNGLYNWNQSSFLYLNGSEHGFSQSHQFQHEKSSTKSISIHPSGLWNFGDLIQNLFIRIGTWVTSATQEAAFSVSVNAEPYIRNTCNFQSVVFNVFDPVSFKPMANQTHTPGSLTGAMYGSAFNTCGPGRTYNFEFRWDSVANRKRAMDFMENHIPDGSYVVVRSFLLDPVTYPGFAPMLKYAADWQNDTLIHGSGKSLYHSLKNAGFDLLDSFNRPRQFAFVYRKNDPSFDPKWQFTVSTNDNATLNADCETKDTIGVISSPVFGPAKAWKELKWGGSSLEQPSGDNPIVSLLGHHINGQIDTLFNNLDLNSQTMDISGVNPLQYPYLQISMVNADLKDYTPYQLKYWRLTYEPSPEGAVSPNLFLSKKDTLDVAEPLDFKLAFKNITNLGFDSVKVKMVITDVNNVQHVLPVQKHRPLAANDTLHIRYSIDTRNLVGTNTLYVEVNPDKDQPEQYHFNNFLYTSFYVRPDTLNPLMDVTFDNVRILNRDIVSSKPNIMIRLKDEAKWYFLRDTATVSVQVKFPDNSVKNYSFDGSVMEYIPAQQSPGADNTATVNLKPFFEQDGEYELMVSGKDMSQNRAGSMQYKVAFQVINKPMISNMLNYPNPFTTSTAFVFTITGSEVPQNIRIQVLTVTGKVVREITKDELGPLHIGRNITEYKWDGTDQYGQKLANGVYLYRVITNHHGQSLDKFKDRDDQTDKYFNKGYGKMVLIR